jgi:hypothetical protein
MGLLCWLPILGLTKQHMLAMPMISLRLTTSPPSGITVKIDDDHERNNILDKTGMPAVWTTPNAVQ